MPLKSRIMAMGQRGKSTAQKVASGKKFSTARTMAKKYPGRTAAGGAVGLAAMGGIASGRRGRGVDRVNGRPTGIRRY